ncbi:MAG: hypothetical protein IJS82_03030 [Paludibacteraceae bacterium]|nr:hypothetical protein [Paludibacteraceae bacterium]
MKKILLFICALWTVCATAQVTPDPNPIPVGYTGEVVITYDASAGNGALANATAIYAHTGLITSASTSTSDWKNVVGSWGSTSQPALTKNAEGKWELTIPNIYTFYGVSTSTDIKALAFVFHDGKGSSATAGKTASGGDILVYLGEETGGDIWDAVEGVTAVTKARPSGVSNGIYYGADGTSVTLCTYAASKTEAAKRVFLLGDMTDWKLSKDYQLYKDGNYFWITLTGLTKGKEYRFQYAVERADGVKKQICDVYSEKVLHPDDQWEPKQVDPTLIDYPTKGADGGYVTVIQPGKAAYDWSSATLNFKRPNKNNLIIYEAWVFDYSTKRTFKGMIERLDYLQNLGVNALELMPVSEFGGNQSWGYNPTLYFAVDKTYGKSDDLKQLIDECHKRGIAVIIDMVFNHTTGLNPMAKLYPWTSSDKSVSELGKNPWFNLSPPEGNNGYGDEEWNHDFGPAHEMFTRVFQYWLKEYKVDGFRLDLSHGLCGNSKNAVANLRDYYNNGVKAVSSDAYMILEHWGDNMAQDQSDLISSGMLCWTGNALCCAYYQTAMGWIKPDDDGHTDAFDAANKDGYVSYAESHDEERMQYKAKMYGAADLKTNETARLGRVAENVAFNVLLNGAHMLYQFEEIGYDISIDYNGRTGTKPNPSTKGYFKQEARIDAFTKCAQVITLRTQLMPSVFEGNPTAANIGSRVIVRTIQWGNNVFAVANFSATDNQTATLPSGTWYDYLNGGGKAGSSYTLKPGELKVFTGSPVQAPTFADIEKRDAQGVEEIGNGQWTMDNGQKILYNGQMLIKRGDKVYTVTGQRVN